MIREPYIGMPIFIGGTPGCMPGTPARPPGPGQNLPSRPPDPPVQPIQPGPPWGADFDARLLGSLPIAMTYTPMQQWRTTYSPSEALIRGTVFPELDLPFEGRTM